MPPSCHVHWLDEIPSRDRLTAQNLEHTSPATLDG
ncbi:hypothetical protein SNOG_03017 [Parastagonospora nodorum SN15]|uniref:Uncharacterized protein n=1 Tax=Phaeosphaeria nodorum (strain SN15 / ATCC MYA-4574 / FGSC 10173) TaxID=321614 RepID=Q0UYZ7_PHANO|nr:hypothetical protein SNOG_03017 [Parastagonospora nodorum SN15]EAT89748.1 hypothetical protein SNOG_03017 [Parastagonospora nodorum SN15]